jgi:hypothetical protein
MSVLLVSTRYPTKDRIDAEDDTYPVTVPPGKMGKGGCSNYTEKSGIRGKWSDP